MADSLTLRQLNRATLARQLLLARERVGPVEAVERLGGLQAQEAKPPFLGLWTRVEGFRREALDAALHDRGVVRATMMRATLHLVSAADYAALRTTLQPVLSGASRAVARSRDAGLDVERVIAAARRLLGERPLTFNELRPLLAAAFPDVDERALGYAVRMELPLAMVPTEDRWSFPSDAAFTPAEPWIGGTLDGPAPEALARRHLGAFGPAAAADVQAWSGLKGMKDVLERMGDELVTFTHGRRTLFDLPGAPRPDEDTPAPPRFLPEFDSLVLAHADRTRVIADEHRAALATRNLRVKATFLVDGFAAGSWTTARKRDTVTLTATPFAKLPSRARDELAAEGEELLAFLDDTAPKRRIEFATP